MNNKIKRKKPHIFTNFLSKWYLMHLGKKDGKRGIPSNKNNPEWMSPTLRKEYAKIDEKMAEFWYIIDKHCGALYAETEGLISKTSQLKLEIDQVHTYLKKEIIPFKDVVGNNVKDISLSEMINTKRENESKCDSLGIRLRRYKEYNAIITSAKNQYFHKKATFKNDYQTIKKNYQIIASLESELDIFFWELCSCIERRTAWYWQGVLLKHPQKDVMPQIPPSAKNDHIKEILEERRTKLADKISKIDSYNQEIFELEYVE